MKTFVPTIAAALVALPAFSGEAILAAGGSDFSIDAARQAGVAEASYRFDTDTVLKPQVTLVAYDAGYGYVGAGAAVKAPFGSNGFGEVSAVAGALIDASDDGGADPAVRVTLAVGRDLGKGIAASVGLSHVASEDVSVDALTFRMHLDL